MADKALIVGVDPGSTSAVAALNLEGELVLLESDKEFPPREIIQRLIEVGHPVVLASDTQKMPSTVEKIASSLGAKKFEPDEDLDSSRKKQLGKGTNSHEIDAVASAVYAYNNLQRKIQKIKKSARESNEKQANIAQSYFSKP